MGRARPMLGRVGRARDVWQLFDCQFVIKIPVPAVPRLPSIVCRPSSAAQRPPPIVHRPSSAARRPPPAARHGDAWGRDRDKDKDRDKVLIVTCPAAVC